MDIDLRDPTQTSVILADGTAATVRQNAFGHIIVSKGSFEIASASIVNGAAVNVRVHGDYTSRGIADLIVRSAKRTYGGARR
jgi:hypothetical protein